MEITENSRYADAWCGKGAATANQGNYEEGINALDEAIRIDPNLVEAWYNKGAVLKALGRTSEANAAFAKAKELGYTV